MRQPLTVLTVLAATAIAGCAATMAPIDRAGLDRAVASSTRTPANVARDSYRNPAATLAFFEVAPTQTVVELWPGGGWYTEILAPYLAEGGRLIAVAPVNGLKGTETLKTRDPATYARVQTVAYNPEAGTTPLAAGSVDTVLTFRNVHNWRMGGMENAQKVFAEAYRMLKPGGVMGIVDHRLPEGRPTADEEKSGYIKVSTVVALAQAAGFVVEAQSEVNANPRDTADWPAGVWTLPPTLRLKDADRAKYVAIGESDRMTIRLRKPRG